jgi:predicted ATP-grasp superfamily ATP-dependent carboligase
MASIPLFRLEPQRPIRGPAPAVISGDLNMLRCFVGRGIPVVVVATDRQEPTLRSRFCERSQIIPAPGRDARGALRELEALGAAFRQAPVLYYGTDEMLLFVSRNRERLERVFRFSMPDFALVDALVDKARFAELAREHALPVPETASSGELSSARDLLERVPLPCAFKPNVHIGWLRERAGRDHADRASKILGWFVGRKIRTYPKEAGVSTFLELVKEPRIMKLGFEIVERLGLVGPLKIDFKKDATSGRFYVLELNPRYTLWCHLGAVSGVNLPKIAYAYELGENCELPRDYRTGIRWVAFGNDLRSFLRSYRPAGELNTAEWLYSLRGKKIYDVFSWRDPLPWLSNAVSYAQAAGRRLQKKRETVHSKANAEVPEREVLS